MADWSGSLFLQALGWATLNSFWQMALLWCCFLLLKHFLQLSSNQKYLFSIWSIVSGFGWFLYTFFSFYAKGNNEGLAMKLPVLTSNEMIPSILSAASVTYLLLLFIPAYRIVNNWRFIQRIKTGGLTKAPYRYRLFVQRIAAHLGIGKKVNVYFSGLITSPVTVGFLKPIILLPVAAMNNLSIQQVEAVLLHELAHIRRHDYLVNLLLTIIHVVLYFNPFIKFFLRRVELERENCCDELVLQFEYDKLGYASALLELERNSSQAPILAMGAVEKNHLLSRVQRIVGVYKKPSFNTAHFICAFVALIFLFMVNSFIITGKKTSTRASLDYFSEPYSFFAHQPDVDKRADISVETPRRIKKSNADAETPPAAPLVVDAEAAPEATELPFMFASVDDVEASLTAEQKNKVATTITKTKKVLQAQWKEVEREIADGLTSTEKVKAKHEYLHELEKVNWNRMEQNLKAEYENIDWNKVDNDLSEALTLARIDSLNACYSQALNELHHVKSLLNNTERCALPDVSVTELQKAKADVQKRVDELKKLRTKKVVRL